MRLALVVAGSLGDASGGYRYDRKLRDGLEARGWEIDVHSVPIQGYHRRLRTGLSESLLRALSEGYDLILQDGLAHPNLVGLNPRLQRRTDAPIVALVHYLRDSDPTVTDRLGLARQYEARYLRGVDAYVFNSRTSRNVAAHWIDPRPRIVAYPGRPTAIDAPRTRDGDSAPLHLVFVGHLHPIKGLDTLLSAVQQLGQSWKLTVVGGHDRNEDYSDRVRRMTRQLGIKEKVTFTGEVEHNEVEEILGDADLLVVPSRYEAFGLVYLEAMAAGVPPVATTAGGAGELIEAERTGYLVEPDDPDALTRLLDRLAGDPTERVRVGAAAARRAAIHPTWEQIAGEVDRFLRALAA